MRALCMLLAALYAYLALGGTDTHVRYEPATRPVTCAAYDGWAVWCSTG